MATSILAPVSTPLPPARVRALQHYFRTLKDPRRRHRRLHRLLDIVTIAICAILCGAGDWQQIATWARCRHDWLRRFLALPHGIPSHDTLERVFDRIDPNAFQTCFRQWIAAVCAALKIPHSAIDGKTLRGSGSSDVRPLHVVSAWAAANHLALAEAAVEEKSNESTAIPGLLELLDLEGALATIDALGCQKDIAKAIKEKGGDYVLAVKDNQPHLLEDIQTCMLRAFEGQQAGSWLDEWQTVEYGHGRREIRSYSVLHDPQGIRNQEAWLGLCVVGMCTRQRTVQEKTSTEVHYFLGSRRAGARVYGRASRGHWGIENNLPWQMDVTFGEDRSRIQKRRGAENFAILRRMALTLLKRHPAKLSSACKRIAAAADTNFLEEILRSGGNAEEL